MLSAAVQRRLQVVVREELAFLSRRSAVFSSPEQGAACLMAHLSGVCSAVGGNVGTASPGGMSGISQGSSGGGGSGSGDESDDSFERGRRLEHLREIFGLSDADAERVALLGDELRKAHRYISSAVDANESGGIGSGGGASRTSEGGAGVSGSGRKLAHHAPTATTKSEVAELRMLAAIDRLSEKLRLLRSQEPPNSPSASADGVDQAGVAGEVNNRAAGSTRPRSLSAGSTGLNIAKRARIMEATAPSAPQQPSSRSLREHMNQNISPSEASLGDRVKRARLS